MDEKGQAARVPGRAAELHRIIQQILGVTAFHSENVRDGKKIRRMTVVASLDDCRAAYDKHTGYEREWDELIPEEEEMGSAPF
jgi:hypothetical protein